jgi:hypothetical protein
MSLLHNVRCRVVRPLVIISLILCAPSVARGQQCAPLALPAFEFQVDVPAKAIPDSTHPHPAADRFAARKDDPGAIIAQFVVDTTGVPIGASLKMLKTPSAQLTDSIKAMLPRWRFTPARMGTCLVSQLVQTTVVR